MVKTNKNIIYQVEKGENELAFRINEQKKGTKKRKKGKEKKRPWKLVEARAEVQGRADPLHRASVSIS